jgi:NAD(P)-dependent dehydrogenase (short-subunit alcohol dehydrogenase family)
VSDIRAVLVTGASTGIGRLVTERLARNGYLVYAGARKESDLQALGSLSNVRSLRLDVTRREDVEEAVDVIQREGSGLYGLVNNAGIVTLGPIVNGNEQEFELAMAVNVTGVYRVTRALAPLVIASAGRIVNVSSVAGILANRNVGAYSMSKHAIEAFTDCLAQELEPVGVYVSAIEPGTFHTRFVENAVARAGASDLLPDCSRYPEPHAVVDAVELALSASTPKRRYLVVPTVDEGRVTIEKQIEQLVQLNEGHRYTCDRNTLVRLLDEALERSQLKQEQAGASDVFDTWNLRLTG